MDSVLEASADGVRVVKISLDALLAIAVAHAAVLVATGSVALLADTIHNFSDETAVPWWIAFILGRRMATRRYAYVCAENSDTTRELQFRLSGSVGNLADLNTFKKYLNSSTRLQ